MFKKVNLMIRKVLDFSSEKRICHKKKKNKTFLFPFVSFEEGFRMAPAILVSKISYLTHLFSLLTDQREYIHVYNLFAIFLH